MGRKVISLTFNFHTGAHWIVDPKHIGDFWLTRVSRSIGRIHGGEIEEIYPAHALKIEVFPDADTFESTNINQGTLETGMFETIVRNDDIQYIHLKYDNGKEMNVSLPFEPTKEGGTDNIHMTSKIGSNRHLYIVVDKENTVDDRFDIS